MSPLPVLTEEQRKLIDRCLEDLDALSDGLTTLTSETHMCEHRTEVATTVNATAGLLRDYVEEHATVGCRQVLSETTQQQSA